MYSTLGKNLIIFTQALLLQQVYFWLYNKKQHISKFEGN